MRVFASVLVLALFLLVNGQPVREDKKQVLVGKIIDLIKREQLRINLIEEEDTTIINEDSVRDELDEMFEENEIQDISDAVDLVTEAVSHQPIFSNKAELSDFNLISEDLEKLQEKQDDEDEDDEEEVTLENMLVTAYQALPEDLQETIKDGVNSVMEK